MGCFDTVFIPCPTCGEKYPAQSKGGDCFLREFELEDCPADVMSDINRHAPYACNKCKTEFHVKFKLEIISFKVVKEPELKEEAE